MLKRRIINVHSNTRAQLELQIWRLSKVSTGGRIGDFGKFLKCFAKSLNID